MIFKYILVKLHFQKVIWYIYKRTSVQLLNRQSVLTYTLKYISTKNILIKITRDIY